MGGDFGLGETMILGLCCPLRGGNEIGPLTHL